MARNFDPRIGVQRYAVVGQSRATGLRTLKVRDDESVLTAAMTYSARSECPEQTEASSSASVLILRKFSFSGLKGWTKRDHEALEAD